MKKNGFTLIEIMGVILILSLILLVAFPSIVGVVKQSGNKIDEATKALIVSAAKDKIEHDKNDYPLNNGNVYCITFQKLIDENYLISDLQDGATGDEIDTSQFVKIEIKNTKYSYTTSKTCTEVKK